MKRMYVWDIIMAVLLIILAALVLYVAHNLSHGRAVEVPAAQMMADWQELQRRAKEHPYRMQADHDE